MVKSGEFISFEGGEGGGKTTQSTLLAQALQEAGIPCIQTREPGGEKGAEAIRELLVQGEADRWEPISEMLLFLAARHQHVERVIKPALAEGKWVISDRFHHSTLVYQGVQGIAPAHYHMLHAATLGNFVPSLTLLLDMPVEDGLHRSLSRDNVETRFEEMDISFHAAVKQGFLDISQQQPQRVRPVNAAQSIAKVHGDILAELTQRFGLALTPQSL